MQVTEKDYLQWTSKPSYMSHKIFDNDLVAIRKSKLTLMLIKPANNGMCILELRKVLMHEFHYDYITNKYGSNWRLFFTETDNFSSYLTKSKYYNYSKKLVIGNMKNENAVVVTKEYVVQKPKIYLLLVDDNSKHKKHRSWIEMLLQQ